MPKIETLGSMEIVIFYGDHGPPHFHVRGRGFRAKVRIEDAAVIAGSIPAKAARRVRGWAVANRAFLEGKWAEIAGP